MSNNDQRRELQTAYEGATALLTQILYEEDPGGMGALVSAPLDEYSEEAVRLMVALGGAETEADVRGVLTACFDSVSDRLVTRVHQTWMEFNRLA